MLMLLVVMCCWGVVRWGVVRVFLISFMKVKLGLKLRVKIWYLCWLWWWISLVMLSCLCCVRGVRLGLICGLY